MRSNPAIYVLVGSRPRGPYSYVWRVWARGTSFYLKARYKPLTHWKVSLHGPDPRHPGLDGFKLACEAAPDALPTDAGQLVSPGMERTWFMGKEMAPGVRHVMRIRTDFTLFLPGVPSAPNPGKIREDDLGALIPPPAPLCAADVDFYVSNGAPYWAGGSKSKRANARLGPIANEAGQVLTAVSSQRLMVKFPSPPSLEQAPRPQGAGDSVRGFSGSFDEDQVLWIREMLLSRKALAGAGQVDEIYTDDRTAS
ncbi:MAG TPA: hypothetical protein VG899_15755 [Mycobacteriales bacterium]|nr:hypothetical protein [Mycobacteriales bacterium]